MMTPIRDRATAMLLDVPLRQWKLSELEAHSKDLRDEVAFAHDPRQCTPCALMVNYLWSERRMVDAEIARRLTGIRERKVRVL